MTYTYKYPRPALTVDCVVFALDESDLKVLLIERGIEPFKKEWALPGGFVNMEEQLEDAALRELQEETGIEHVFLEQLYTFGTPNRDPRDRVVSVAYFALINLSKHKVKAGSDAHNAGWFSVDELPSLAFDHAIVLNTALERLRGKVRYQPIGFELLPQKFALSQLQHMYEIILEKQIDKRNFRKRILKMDLLTELDEVQKDVAHRAARLYSFDKKKYDRLAKKGFNFEL